MGRKEYEEKIIRLIKKANLKTLERIYGLIKGMVGERF